MYTVEFDELGECWVARHEDHDVTGFGESRDEALRALDEELEGYDLDD